MYVYIYIYIHIFVFVFCFSFFVVRILLTLIWALDGSSHSAPWTTQIMGDASEGVASTSLERVSGEGWTTCWQIPGPLQEEH